MSMIEDNIIPILIIIVLLFSLNCVLLKKYYTTIFDPMSISVFILSVAVADVCVLWLNTIINDFDLYKNIFLIYMYIAGLVAVAMFFDFNLFIDRTKKYISEAVTLNDKIFFWILFFFCFSTTMYFSYTMIGASQGDERIVVAANNRFLDIIKRGTGCFGLMALIMWDKSHDRIYLFSLALIVLPSLFSGSKGGILSLVTLGVLYSFLTNNTMRKTSVKKLAIYLVGGVIALGGMILSLLIFGNDFENSVNVTMFRILFPADAYLYAYQWGDYRLIGVTYDWLEYIMHPFLKLAGSSGYDYPLGVVLFGQHTGDYSGFGPNPILPILAMVLFNDNILCASIFVFGVGIITAFVGIVSNKVNSKNEFLYFFFAWSLYPSCLGGFMDVSFWMQHLIAVIIMFVILKSISWLLIIKQR